MAFALEQKILTKRERLDFSSNLIYTAKKGNIFFFHFEPLCIIQLFIRKKKFYSKFLLLEENQILGHQNWIKARRW